MDTLTQDIRFALRTFRKNPGFTAIALLTLALGIGANTAIFSVVNAVLIRALPYEQPESLVVLWGNVQRAEIERRGASFPDFGDWRAQNRSFEDLAWYSTPTFTLTGRGDEPERVTAEMVSPGYFELLRVRPAPRPRVRGAASARPAGRSPSCSATACGRADSAAIRRSSAPRCRCPIGCSRSSA